jgi:sugar O-acyltransferase (sialic acid O-acetyltransferase NeuD family)
MIEAASSSALLVLGGGGHGRVVAEAAFLSRAFSRIAVVDPRDRGDWPFDWCTRVQDEADIDARPDAWHFIAAVGETALRRRLHASYTERGFRPAMVRHPAASVSLSAQIGDGVMLHAGAVVASGARLGNGVIVNHNAVIEHDCLVGDFSHLAPGAVIAGTVHLGANCFVGANASLRHGVSVADGVVIGHGAAVVSDLERPGTYLGQPASLHLP